MASEMDLFLQLISNEISPLGGRHRMTLVKYNDEAIAWVQTYLSQSMVPNGVVNFIKISLKISLLDSVFKIMSSLVFQISKPNDQTPNLFCRQLAYRFNNGGV
jgi:hypothetical protein